MLMRFLEENFSKDDSTKLEPCQKNIHLLAHSMGNRVLEAMVEQLRWTYEELPELFSEIVLTVANRGKT